MQAKVLGLDANHPNKFGLHMIVSKDHKFFP